MLTKIGENAGAIWNALQAGALTLKGLKKATKLKNEELYLALGWLARENKLAFSEEDGELVVALA
ncbi:MAG: winged helix-turn-helix domain-containing protein [Paludibacteraceae bacterium]|nr:winged helix-turn-helix domain-containing protein [Paludibacteraceae bacterium]